METRQGPHQTSHCPGLMFHRWLLTGSWTLKTQGWLLFQLRWGAARACLAKETTNWGRCSAQWRRVKGSHCRAGLPKPELSAHASATAHAPSPSARLYPVLAVSWLSLICHHWVYHTHTHTHFPLLALRGKISKLGLVSTTRSTFNGIHFDLLHLPGGLF